MVRSWIIVSGFRQGRQCFARFKIRGKFILDDIGGRETWLCIIINFHLGHHEEILLGGINHLHSNDPEKDFVSFSKFQNKAGGREVTCA